MIVRLDSNQKIYVIPDIPFTQYTGYTPTYLIGSGATTCTNVSGNTWIVYANPTGATVTWGGITGTLSDQTDLQAALNAKSGTGHTHTGVYAPIIHTHPYSGLTGLPTLFSGDYNDLTNKPDLNIYALETDLTGHTSDSSIHFTMDTVDLAISAATSGLTSSWNKITDKPSWLSGITLNDFENAHSHSQYLTGFTVTAPMVTGITASLYAPIIHTHSYNDLTNLPVLFSGDYDDLTNKPDLSQYALEIDLTGHTSDSSIHTTMTQVNQAISAATSGLTSSWNEITDKPSWLSGTTLNDFESAHSHSQYLTGFTVTAPMVTGITASLYAPIIHTHAYSAITDTPDLSVYQPISGMSAYLTGVTWNIITGDISNSTALQSALNLKLDNSAYQADMLVLSGVIDDLEETVSGHTGNTTVHTTMTQVNDAISAATSGLTSISDFQTYTGTTAPAQFFPASGYSFVASGACEIATSGNEVTIYAPSGGTGGGVSEAVFSGYTGTTAPATYMAKIADILVVTGTSKTIGATDLGKVLEFTATGATSIVLPTGLTVGTQFTVVNLGGQVITFTAGSGASIKSKYSMLKLSAQYDAATAYYRGSNVWVLFGDLSTT